MYIKEVCLHHSRDSRRGDSLLWRGDSWSESLFQQTKWSVAQWPEAAIHAGSTVPVLENNCSEKGPSNAMVTPGLYASESRQPL